FRDFDVPGLPRSRYGAAAVDLGPESDTDPELVRDFAERTVEGGYGVYLTYQLQEGDQTELVSAFTEPLYGSPAHVGGPRAVPPAAEQPPPHAPTDPPRGPAPCAAELPGPAAPWDDRYSPVHVTRRRHEYEWLNMQLGVYTSGMASTPVVPTPPATAPGSGAARRPRAAVVGASGYAGGETLRLLAGHPDLDVATVTAHSSAGKRLSQVAPHIDLGHDPVLQETTVETLRGHDVVVLALPHGQSGQIAAALRAEDPDVLVLDLGADHRLESAEEWEAYYGSEHSGTWTYGMPELPLADGRRQRELLVGAREIAVPGCNATAVSLALAPLVRAGLIDATRMSAVLPVGPSGAGRAPKQHLLFSEISGAASAYAVGGTHRHVPEVLQNLRRATGRDDQ